MRNNHNPVVSDAPNSETNWLTAPLIARTERQHRAHGSDADNHPGVVIPGESSTSEGIPESGESYEMVAIGNGKGRVIAHPLPSPDTPISAAITDWLNCTFPFKTSPESLSSLFTDIVRVLGPQFGIVAERGKGLNGYERSFTLGEDGAMFGCVGQRNTGLLMFPGNACHTITDWPGLIELLQDRYRARITRWDGAVDDFAGTHSVDEAVALYLDNKFNVGGNRPSCKQNGNWIEPDGTGRTFYVGKRKNGKMLRVYEKGMQCGVPWHPWVRWELELHNIDREIPWEVVLEPGRYLAGAYPKALGWVQEDMSRIRTIRTEMRLSYDHLVDCASKAYGPLINVMTAIEGSPEQIIERLRRDQIPKRLQFPIVPDGVK
jgi:phage replication initiation protein